MLGLVRPVTDRRTDYELLAPLMGTTIAWVEVIHANGHSQYLSPLALLGGWITLINSDEQQYI